LKKNNKNSNIDNYQLNICFSPEKETEYKFCDQKNKNALIEKDNYSINNNSKISTSNNNINYVYNQIFFGSLNKEDENAIEEYLEFNQTKKCLILLGNSNFPKEEKINLLNKTQKANNTIHNKVNNLADNKNFNPITNKSKSSEKKVKYPLQKSSTIIKNKNINKIIIEETDKISYNLSNDPNIYYRNKKNFGTNFKNNQNNFNNNYSNNNNNYFSYYEKLSKLNSKNSEFRVYSYPEKSLLSLSDEEQDYLISNEEFKNAKKIAGKFEHFIELFKENFEKKLMQISDTTFRLFPISKLLLD
jgi:hypothetical protein